MSRTLIGPRIAVYPGAFNPFHIGHHDILRQSLGVFDAVYLAVGRNRTKNDSRMKSVDRLHQIKEQIGGYESAVFVEGYDMLLTNYLIGILESHHEIPKLHIVRGLRSGYDLDYEINFRKTVSDLDDRFEFAYFLPSHPNYYHVSSSMIRELSTYDMRVAKRYIYNAEMITDEIVIS